MYSHEAIKARNLYTVYTSESTVKVELLCITTYISKAVIGLYFDEYLYVCTLVMNCYVSYFVVELWARRPFISE